MLVDTLVTMFAPAAGEIAQAASGQQVRLTGARILLAEDNDVNQQIAVELLEGVGASIAVANNGSEAIELLLREPAGYDLILMDLQMPEMGGYEATEKIRADPRFADLPIIAMTAHATAEEKQRCLDAGMNEHVSKPIDPTALFETVSRFYKPAAAPSPSVPNPEAEIRIAAHSRTAADRWQEKVRNRAGVLDVGDRRETSQRDDPVRPQDGNELEHFSFEHPELAVGPITAKVMYTLGGARDIPALEFMGVGIQFVGLDEASARLLEGYLEAVQ
jgi:CheY-like chemotaxis protein